MKTKLYIVTYNNNEILNNWALKTLFESDFPIDNSEIYIINNHSNIYIEPQYKDKIKILNNDLRPDFSTGHLSRNWNQAIINGFKNLNEPDCDLVIACQNDTKFCKNWYSKLIITMLRYGYKYMTCGIGDQLQIFTADSIKNIGLYDERFCNIGYQEGDYFLRAILCYSDYSSINDYFHRRVLNPIDTQIIEATKPGALRHEPTHIASALHGQFSCRFWQIKWGFKEIDWNMETIFDAKPRVKNYILYPYFEKDILNLEEKYY